MQDITTPTQQIKLISWHNRRLMGYSLLVVVNFILFAFTSPLESTSLIVISGFLVVALDIVLLASLFVRFLCLLLPRVKKYQRRLTVAIAVFAIVLTALASLGQLTWRDTVVVVIVGLIGYLYSLRFRLGVK